MTFGDLIKELSSYCGAIVTIIGLIVLIIKPLRSWFVNWITKTTDHDTISEKIDLLTIKVQKTIEQNETMQKELDKQSEALQASLRNSLLRIYNDHMKTGQITMYEKENVNKLFTQYQSLKGNSFVEQCVQELNVLPVRDN